MKSQMRLGMTVVALAMGLAIGGNTTQNASAATWHRGTPKALRGKWTDGKKEAVLNYYPFIIVKPKELSESGIDPVINKHLHYRHKKGSHIYDVRGHETMYSHGKLVNYYRFKLSKTTRKHKSHKVKFYIYKQRGNGQDYQAKKAKYGHYFYK
ncbi:hypothetical protein ACFQ44_02465 [Levilactobacillus lanxiensis]|uniref:Uncharacterized protein n=1 Tax=Levilactobacillus lanxiensis TaxID=2799568 RepID=A0ABW4D0V5_9LACO|nr:hypothetical protein [Levilactobacillus lanxiensis]